MGATDPLNYLLPILSSLESFSIIKNIFVIIGTEYKFIDELKQFSTQSCKNIEIHVGTDEPSRQMRLSDLAIVSFGMTAYELAALRVPSMYICISEDHAESASALEKACHGISLGNQKYIDTTLMGNYLARTLELASLPKIYLDTHGASRIVEVVSCF